MQTIVSSLCVATLASALMAMKCENTAVSRSSADTQSTTLSRHARSAGATSRHCRREALASQGKFSRSQARRSVTLAGATTSLTRRSTTALKPARASNTAAVSRHRRIGDDTIANGPSNESAAAAAPACCLPASDKPGSSIAPPQTASGSPCRIKNKRVISRTLGSQTLRASRLIKHGRLRNRRPRQPAQPRQRVNFQTQIARFKRGRN
jgi:hypothetical protein